MDHTSPAASDIDALRTLADRNGVSTFFWDWYGQKKDVSAESLLAVLHSLGVAVDEESTVEEVAAALEETENRAWRRILPPTIVAREGAPREFPVHVPDGSWVRVAWIGEDGTNG